MSAGAALVVAIGWLFGLLVPFPVVAATNSQVAGRVHPELIDLIGALATGAVGSFALVRSDVSDTLPGVAIAISLVPPLAVVGLTLQSDAGHESVGALLLCSTNVGAILLTGLIVMAIYRVSANIAPSAGGVRRRTAMFMVVAFVVLLTGTDGTEVHAAGPLPGPDPTAPRHGLASAGHPDIRVVLDLVPSRRIAINP